VVTFLFTDLVSSTEFLARLGDEAAEGFRRSHFRMLREAVAAHGGQEVKNLGDGLMVVFTSPADAVACAVMMQQAVDRQRRRQDMPVEVRIGLELGEPSREGDDYFGTPVVVASRLCGLARGNQILVSSLVRGVVATRRGFNFRSLPPLTLKGLAEPVSAWEVVWEPREDDALPLSARVAAGRNSVFVGRQHELQRLREIWESVRNSERRTVLVSGEPGIGKTGLSTELALSAHGGGAIVLYGRCDEEAVVSFQPFVEALSHYVLNFPVDELREQLGASAAQLARLVPRLVERLPELQSLPHQVDEDRYWLFEAVESMLRAASRRQPVLLILDDLHWADRPTLLLLRHLVRTPERAALLICATYRHTDLAETPGLAEMLADLAGEPGVERMALTGLNEADVWHLMEAVSGLQLDAGGSAVSRALVEGTEGNPLFVRETIRHLVQTGRLRSQDGVLVLDGSAGKLDISDGLREVISRRLRLLSRSCRRTLNEASVLGREFVFDVLCEMASTDSDEVLAAVEEAVATEILVELPAGRSATYAFTHVLVRQTLYDELSLARRQRVHLRAAQVMERMANDFAGVAPPSVVAGLAAHYQAAGSAADVEKVIEYSVLAGEQCRRQFAWEDAIPQWDTALRLMEEHQGDPRRRAELLEQIADVMYQTGIDFARSAEYLERALALYQFLGDPMRAAQVHSRLGRNLSTLPDAMDLPRAFAHFEAARAVMATGPERPALGYLYSGLAAAHIGSGDAAAGLEAATMAVDAGKRLGNDALCANAGLQRGWHLFMAGEISQGLELMEEAYQKACVVELPWVSFQAATFRCILSICLGDPQDGLFAVQRELAKPQVARAPIQRKVLLELSCQARVMLGDVEGARRTASEASGGYFSLDAIVATALGDTERAEQCWRARLRQDRASGARWWQIYDAHSLSKLLARRGELQEAERFLLDALALASERETVAPEGMWIRPALAIVYADLGQLEQAEQHLARARRIIATGGDWRGAAGRTALAEGLVAGARGDVTGAEEAFARALLTTRAHSLVWEQAEVLRRWGLFLLAQRHPEAAEEKLDGAAALYRGSGAGKPWLDSLWNERRRMR
jgi:class 3 adenylate cyclase/tetratricopeptide (TPR) repeat protein